MLPKWLQPRPDSGAHYPAGLLEQVADGVYVREKSGHIVYANAALCTLSGYTRAELVRMHGEYTIADLMEVFSVGRATVYRFLNRAFTSTPGPAAGPEPSPNTPA